MGHEKDPMGSLAAYLSALSDKFDNDGLGTWSIRKNPQIQTGISLPEHDAA
jgi:hypothetical protein